MYDPRKDWHWDIIKGFHQSLIDDRYPPIDTERFVKNLLPGVMAELERLKGENKRLEAENQRLKDAINGVVDQPRTKGPINPGRQKDGHRVQAPQD